MGRAVGRAGGAKPQSLRLPEDAGRFRTRVHDRHDLCAGGVERRPPFPQPDELLATENSAEMPHEDVASEPRAAEREERRRRAVQRVHVGVRRAIARLESDSVHRAL